MKSDRPDCRWLRLGAGTAGVSTIEFVFVASMLAILAVGSLDFGMGLWQAMEVGNAARAGAEYASVNASSLMSSWSTSGISSAVTHATGLSSVQASPAPSKSCACANTASGLVAATCGSTCSGGNPAGTYVTVNAQASYSTVLSYPVLSNPMTLTASAVARIN